jgi:hypothetical protein
VTNSNHSALSKAYDATRVAAATGGGDELWWRKALMDCYRARIRVVVLAVLLSVAASASWAQRISIGPDQRYLLLATQRTATMQAELDEAAAAGFRIVAGSPAAAEMVLFLERVTEPPDTYTYRLLATSRTSTMERELNDAAAEGFRLLPQTAMAHASTTRRLLGGASAPNEVVVVMERGPRAETRYADT